MPAFTINHCRFSQFLAFISTTVLAVSLSAQTSYYVSGTVKNALGRPIFGAVVQLKTNGKSAVTDTLGTYLISGSVRALGTVPTAMVQGYRIQKNTLTVLLDISAHVSAALYDFSGKERCKINDCRLSAGTHRFSIAPDLAAGICFLKLTIGDQRSVNLVCKLADGSSTVLEQAALSAHGDSRTAKTAPLFDSLIASASGYASRTVPVEKNNDTVNIVLTSNGVVDATTLRNKIMAGYQGWFYAKNDGGFNQWSHWCSPRQSVPAADNVLFDMWPDLREFAESELYPTGFTYKDGRNAGLYSSYNAENVVRHMKWCQDYGIDGVFVQRFMASIHDGHKTYRDKVLLNVKAGAEAHGRVFVNMWDINSLETKGSSWQHAGLVDQIKADWMHLVDTVGITNSSRYLRHNGKPLVAIWGVSKLEVMDPQYANQLVDWFKQGAAPRYQASVMFGVANEVGSSNVDWTDKSSEWQAVFKKVDIISPWTVGRFKNESGADDFYVKHIKPDKQKCNEYGVDYLPVVFPGFSHCQKRADPCNSCPRDGGKFLWRQFYNVVRAGSNMVYVAMFDEVDEGTAIYKIAENQNQTPVEIPNNFNNHVFIAMDADGYKLPSDWYLRLAGETGRILRKETGLTQTIPINP